MGDVRLADELIGHRWQRVLTDQVFGRDLRAWIAGFRSHVPMRQLEPGPGKGVGKLLRIFPETTSDLLLDGIKSSNRNARFVVNIMVGTRLAGWRAAGAWNLFRHVFRPPLLGAGRACRQFPLIVKEHSKITHVPPGGSGCPGAFQAADDGVIPPCRC